MLWNTQLCQHKQFAGRIALKLNLHKFFFPHERLHKRYYKPTAEQAANNRKTDTPKDKQSEVIHRMGTSINTNRYSSQHTKHSMYTRNRHLQRAPMLLWTLVIFAAELKIGKFFYTTFNFFYILIYDENTIKNAI